MRNQIFGGVCVLGLVGGSLNLPPASATTETVIHSFGAGEDGNAPIDGVIVAPGGALFGLTRVGGIYCGFGCGTAFELSPPAAGGSQWTESVLHSFQQIASDGSEPDGGLLAGPDGVFYGTTVGTDNAALRYGNVFQLTPPAPGKKQWTVKSLYRFKGGSDGTTPVGRLVADAAGALYGTTLGEGSPDCVAVDVNFGCGTVFKLTPPAPGKTYWTHKVLYGFHGGTADGYYPQTAPIFDAAGALYGTTPNGGGTGCSKGQPTSGCGVAYKLSPPAPGGTAWTESIIYSFKAYAGGHTPMAGLLAGPGGSLYGTTSGGGIIGSGGGNGVVFQLTPPASGKGAWTEHVLYRFAGGADGRAPGALIADSGGALYGATLYGGTETGTICGQNHGCGAVFRLAPPAAGQTAWTESVLYRFGNGPEGGFPNPALTADANGILYGTTGGGGSNSKGVAFSLTGTGYAP